MSVEQRLGILEGIVEQLLLDKAMAPIDNGGGAGLDTHTFPILTDGGGSTEVSIKGTSGSFTKTDHITFKGRTDSNITVDVVDSLASGIGKDVEIGMYYV